ncbi:hypothetical protein L208DRAFT_1380159 [Tricholoma matsutake]|nr:hypothetical protein L208DRAFT_1380159 [Tricholoma matsutake 945]
MSSKKNSNARPIPHSQSKRKVVESDESEVEIIKPNKKKCVDIVQPDGTAKSRRHTPPPGSPAYQQLPGVSVLNMVLAAMQSVATSGSLPIFGSQGLARPGSAVTAIKDLTLYTIFFIMLSVTLHVILPSASDAKGGKQPAAHPERIKIKTEKAMYMESIKPDTAAQASPLIKRKSKPVKSVVPVPEPLSVLAVTFAAHGSKRAAARAVPAITPSCQKLSGQLLHELSQFCAQSRR